MSGPVSTEEFPYLSDHKKMWSSFAHLLLRSIFGIAILIVFIGFITGTL